MNIQEIPNAQDFYLISRTSAHPVNKVSATGISWTFSLLQIFVSLVKDLWTGQSWKRLCAYK